MKAKLIKNTIIFLLVIGSVIQINAQSKEADDLAQKMQNPLANLVAIPVMNSIYTGVGPNEETTYGVSFQPIFPIEFKKFNLINRMIFGVQQVPSGIHSSDNESFEEVAGGWGVTDLNYTSFFSPKRVNKIAWGVGPNVNIPTASSSYTGSGKWSVGPSAVFVYQYKKWIFDVVMRQAWSIGGSESKDDVNQFNIQPLIAYGLGKGFIISTFPTITANWDAEKDERWAVPVGAGVSKVLFLGKLPVAVAAQYYNYVVQPVGAPSSEIRLTTTFILSK